MHPNLYWSCSCFLQQWHGSSGQASLPHLKFNDLHMSDSKELSNITAASSMYLLLHVFFLSDGFWNPKDCFYYLHLLAKHLDRTEAWGFSWSRFFSSLICELLSTFFGFKWKWVLNSCQHTGNEDQNTFLLIFVCFFFLFALVLSLGHGLPLTWEVKMLKAYSK